MPLYTCSFLSGFPDRTCFFFHNDPSYPNLKVACVEVKVNYGVQRGCNYSVIVKYLF